MNCSEYRDLLSPYLDGALVETDKRKLENHLRNCHACQQELYNLRATITILHNWAENELALPDGFAECLQIKLAQATIPWYRRLLVKWLSLTAAAAIVLTVGISVYANYFGTVGYPTKTGASKIQSSIDDGVSNFNRAVTEAPKSVEIAQDNAAVNEPKKPNPNTINKSVMTQAVRPKSANLPGGGARNDATSNTLPQTMAAMDSDTKASETLVQREPAGTNDKGANNKGINKGITKNEGNDNDNTNDNVGICAAVYEPQANKVTPEESKNSKLQEKEEVDDAQSQIIIDKNRITPNITKKVTPTEK